MMRTLGRTHIPVSPLGLGTIALGEPKLSEAEAERLLLGALELGVVLVDAARSYGLAEDRIGRYLGGRRSECILSTKLGYGVEGVPDWTGPSVTGGVERALRALRTSYIDVVHLHSCPRAVLEAGEVPEALYAAREAGKIRAAAYSGDGDALQWAVDHGRFDVVQASFSLCDRANRPALERAGGLGLGRMAKRPLANAPWRPEASSVEPYGPRWARMALNLEDPFGVALRYVVFHGPADVALLGTGRLSHLEDAVRTLEAGPLPAAELEHIEARWAECGAEWPAHI